MNRLQVLKKLESSLEGFLGRAVGSDEERLEMRRVIDSLDDVARESLKGRYINNRLANWFSRNKGILDSDWLRESDVTSIANLLSSIKSGLDISDSESKKLTEEIEHWRNRGVVPRRKLILKLRPKSGEKDLVKEFADLLAQESRYVNAGEFENMHLLSALDDVLKSAEAKEDKMYAHLAGSIIYYLKTNGYKVDPFVKKLKEIEQKKSGDAGAE